MEGLTVEDLVLVARRSVGDEVAVRDVGLLTAALARVEACAFGVEVYPTVLEKAAALLHSLLTSCPLREGNRPFALAATLTFLAQRGHPLALPAASAVSVVTAVVTGRLETVRDIAAALEHGVP